MAGILLHGGSFDPVHHGHLIVARSVAERIGVERIVLIPGANPLKIGRSHTPGQHRLAMCRLAAMGDPLFEVSDWELRQQGPNYSLVTVRHFRHVHADQPLFWLLGMDSLLDLGAWYKAGELADACTLVTAARPGHEKPSADRLASIFTPPQVERILTHVFDTPQIDIRATDIRERVRAGRSIRYLTPDAVREYIAMHKLYH